MRCPTDLRKRVVDFVRGGGSKSEAARRFQVGRASVYRWLSPDGLSYERPGPQGGRKLDREALRAHVLAHKERAQHFGVSSSSIGCAMKKIGLSRKKNARV